MSNSAATSRCVFRLTPRVEWVCGQRTFENKTLNYGGAVEYDYQVNKKICHFELDEVQAVHAKKKKQKIWLELGLVNSQDFFFMESQYPVILEIIKDL